MVRILPVLVALAMCAPMSADAATVRKGYCSQGGYNCALGIVGLEHSGATYDVVFRNYPYELIDNELFPDFSDYAEMVGLAGVINALLDDAGAVRIGVDDGGASAPWYFLAPSSTFPFAGSYFLKTTNADANMGANWSILDFEQTCECVHRMYATFYPAPVPIPAAAWLFASAIGLLGWLRAGSL